MKNRTRLDVELLRSAFDYNHQTGKITLKKARGNLKAGTELGRVTEYGYLRFQFLGKDVFAHRVDFAIFHGYAPDVIDHINGDRLDNRISNLRPADMNINARNCRGKRYRKSDFKGVSATKCANRWRASIRCGGGLIALGVYCNQVEAAYAYDVASLELHGEYGKRNFLPLVV